MYANSPGVEFLIHYRSLFFHLHIPWRGRPVKIPLGMNFSLVCRVQRGNVLSLKDIQDYYRVISTRKLKFFKSENDLTALTYAEQISTLLLAMIHFDVFSLIG